MKCREHPRYRGARRPRGDCLDCWTVYYYTDREALKRALESAGLPAIDEPARRAAMAVIDETIDST